MAGDRSGRSVYALVVAEEFVVFRERGNACEVLENRGGVLGVFQHAADIYLIRFAATGERDGFRELAHGNDLLPVFFLVLFEEFRRLVKVRNLVDEVAIP